MNNVETNKYKVRSLTDDDFEDVKVVVKTNKFLGRLWNIPVLSDDLLDEMIKDIFMKEDGHGVVDKNTGEFAGFISFTPDDKEGELAVRMKEHVDMREIMELFAEILKDAAPKDGETSFMIQYSFE